MTKDARLIAYFRVSSLGDREGESFQSLDQQREACEGYARLRGCTIIDTVEAPNASGGKAWPEPKLAEVIARVDRGEADGVVVYSVDRWGRSLDALSTIERWAQDGRTFLSASDQFDATTASGRMALRMMVVVASYYWEASRERFAVSQERAIRRGAAISPAPLGYVRGDAGKLTPDPVYGPVVREAFKLAARDDIHAAADHLAALVPQLPRRRKQPDGTWQTVIVPVRWDTDRTRRLLANRAYLGEIRSGKLTNTNAHEPLATLADFEAAQTRPRLRRTAGDYELSGIARCAGCGGPMAGNLQAVKGHRYRRYRCSNRWNGGGHECSAPASISADALETYTREAVVDALAAFTLRVKHPGTRGLAKAQTALERAIDDVDRWTADDRARDLMGDAAWYRGLERRAAAVEEARATYQDLAGRSARTEALPTVDQLDDPAKYARALRAMVDRIEVKAGRGDIDKRVSIIER